MSSLSLISRNGRKSPRIMHGRLIEKISWSTCGRHVTLWHRSAFENRIVTTNSSMIKPPFLRAFGYHSDKIGRYSFSLAGRLGSEVPGGYARPLETRTRMDCQHIKSDMQVFFSPSLSNPCLPCLYLTTNAQSHCGPVVSNLYRRLYLRLVTGLCFNFTQTIQNATQQV